MTIRIDLWLWPLDQPPAPFAAHLDAEEEARAVRFLRPGHGDAFRVGRGRMREILSGYTGRAPDMLDFAENAHGKPFLAGGPAFNLSHSGGWAALAVTENPVPLGVDIEAYRPVEKGVARHFFSRSEVAALTALPAAGWQDGFFRCWTRKEAFVKACGPGLSLPLRDFDVSLAPGEAARLTRIAPQWGRAEDWVFHHLDLAPRMVGAVAVEARGAAIDVALCEGRLPLPQSAP